MSNEFEIKDGVLIGYHGNGGDIVIPSGVTGIGDSAFLYCRNLTRVVISEGVKNIGNNAFYGCTNLTSVTFPDSVSGIGQDVFAECTSLTKLVIYGELFDIEKLYEQFKSAFYIPVDTNHETEEDRKRRAYRVFVTQIPELFINKQTRPTLVEYSLSYFMKCHLIFSALEKYPKNQNIMEIFRKHRKESFFFEEMFARLMGDKSILRKAEIVRALLDAGLADECQIDKCIEYATDYEQDEVQALLTEYKTKNNR